MRKSKIISIYPGFVSLYYGFYLLGLQRQLPDAKIVYDNSDYPYRNISYLAFNYQGKRFLIDAIDFPSIDAGPLSWCDVCGKINLWQDAVDFPGKQKISAIGPSFGVRYLSLYQAIPQGVRNYLKSKLKSKYFRPLMSNYVHQNLSRLPEEEYRPSNSAHNYIFSIHTYWKEEPFVNETRRNFISCVSDQANVDFEGGFYNHKQIEDPNYQVFQINRSYPLQEYLLRTKKSSLVFNTPAVKGCLGWKLGEYLALGKAIISTQINQALPEPLIHEKHIHFVDGSKESIEAAIAQIQENRDYRLYLEQNAREYYLNHLQPQKVIARLLSATGIDDD